MKRPSRTLIASFSHQLVAVATLLSFGMQAFGAATAIPNPKTIMSGYPEPTGKDASWDKVPLPQTNPAPQATSATGGALTAPKKVKTIPITRPAADDPALGDNLFSKEPSSGRHKSSGFSPTASQPEKKGLKPLCFDKKDQNDDEKEIKAWWKELGQDSTSKFHKLSKFQDTRLPFLETAERHLTNLTGQNRDGHKQGLCEYRRSLVKNIATLGERVRAEPPTGAACARVNELFDMQKQRYKDLQLYKDMVSRTLKGGEFMYNNPSTGTRQRVQIEGLAQQYMKGIHADNNKVMGIQRGKSKLTSEEQTLFLNLRREYWEVWGQREPLTDPKQLETLDNRGIYSVIFNQFKAEGEEIKGIQAQLETSGKELKEKFPQCWARVQARESGVGQGDPANNPPGNGTPSPHPHGDPDNSGIGTITGEPAPETDEQKIARLEGKCPSLETDSKAQAACYRDLTAAKHNVEANKKQIEAYRNSTSSSYNSPGQPPPSIDPPPNPLRTATFTNTDSASSFLSENAGLLVGGGLLAAGGAGLYFWDKSEKDKRQKDWESYWANVQASTAGSSTTGTSSATSRTLMVKSGVGNAAVSGVNLPAIQVAIVDGSGNTLTGQDVDIIMSCTTPIPCYMTGTTTVRSVNGVATFSDIRFTQGVTGVRIRFAAPWGGVDQSNSFDVQPLAGSTNTATSTSTLSGTATSTGTSTGTDTRL